MVDGVLGTVSLAQSAAMRETLCRVSDHHSSPISMATTITTRLKILQLCECDMTC